MTTQVERPPVVQFVGGFIVTTLIFPLIILGAGGNWQWVEGWLFALWFDVMVLANMTYLYFKDPALLAERRKRPGSDNQKGWDAVMLSGIYVVALAWLAIVPLDAARFHWPPAFPLWLKFAGGLLLLPALYLIQRATMENTYLSTLTSGETTRAPEPSQWRLDAASRLGIHLQTDGRYGKPSNPRLPPDACTAHRNRRPAVRLPRLRPYVG